MYLLTFFVTVIMLLIILIFILVPFLYVGLTTTKSIKPQNRPNLIFILTDDQDQVLGGSIPMIKTRKLLKQNGAEFKNMFVTSPLCCPSRASILTGRYAHNHGVVNNSINGNCASYLWQSTEEKKTFVTHLKKINYTTFYAGKYLNKYGLKTTGGLRHIPPGWDQWIGLGCPTCHNSAFYSSFNIPVGNSRYYNYTLSINGKPEIHGDNDSTDYLTKVISEKLVEFLKYVSPEKPFFMMIAPPSPHKPFTPELKYEKNFSGNYAPRTPNFNVHVGKDKHWLLRQPPNPLPKKVIQYIDEIFKQRWRTLLSVDDLIEKLIFVLKEKKILANTYLFFSSDNGFHLGQFSLPEDKRQLYEFDVRVPLYVRGPGIKHKLKIMEPVLNIDLAPTFLELVGVQPPKYMDGMSLVPLLFGQKRLWREQFIIEYKGEAANHISGCPQYSRSGVHTCEVDCICEDSWNNTYVCLRTLTSSEDSVYCRFKDHENFIEAYNLAEDPYQMHNIFQNFSSKYQYDLKCLQFCLGITCIQNHCRNLINLC